MKEGTVALVIGPTASTLKLVEAISDTQEISILEGAILSGHADPMALLADHRKKVALEDEEFGNYVEELLSQPFLRADVQKQGVQWLRSKLKIEEFKRAEAEATKVIADFAFKIYMDNRQRTEFLLAGPTSRVRVKVLEIQEMARSAVS
jgi:hypothetical protein